MANDVPVYDNCGNYVDDTTLMTSDYAVLEGSFIRIRGSKFIEFDNNFFDADAIRRLARYLLELADEAGTDPRVDSLGADIAGHYASAYGFEYDGADFTGLAATLIRLGYRK